MSDTFHTDTLRLASELPVGDPTRRRLLAALAATGASMGESIDSYQKLAEDFAAKFHVKLFNLRHGGDVVKAEFAAGSQGQRWDAQVLAAWLKRANVKFISVGGKSVTLHWFP